MSSLSAHIAAAFLLAVLAFPTPALAQHNPAMGARAHDEALRAQAPITLPTRDICQQRIIPPLAPDASQMAARGPPPPSAITATVPHYVSNANDSASILRDSDSFEAFYAQHYGAPADEAATIAAQLAANTPPYWDVGARGAALVQMYDLVAPLDIVRACRYLDRLDRINTALLAGRDDHRLNANGRHLVDPSRGRTMPAWGAFTRDREDRWNTDVSTSGLFVYPMAAFARRVADTPGLQARYGADAIRFTTAVIETYSGFIPEQHLAPDDPLAYFENPEGYRAMQCFDENQNCINYRASAGYPLAFNENLSMMKALADLALAADSPLYRGSSDASPLYLFIATEEAPLLVAKNFAYFDRNLHTDDDRGAPIFWWNHQGDIPDVPTRIQNTPHAGFELGSLAVLLDDKIRINALLARHGQNVALALSTPLFVRFANTFLRKIWNAQNLLSEKVNGDGKRDGSYNVECAGFIPLAQFDRWVWIRCRDATFLSAEYLRVDNYAALLRYRQYVQ